MLKSKTMAYDGRGESRPYRKSHEKVNIQRTNTKDFPIGNYRVNSKDDIPDALEALKDRPLYAEKWAYFKMVRLPLHTLKTRVQDLTWIYIGTGRHGCENQG